MIDDEQRELRGGNSSRFVGSHHAKTSSSPESLLVRVVVSVGAVQSNCCNNERREVCVPK